MLCSMLQSGSEEVSSFSLSTRSLFLLYAAFFISAQ